MLEFFKNLLDTDFMPHGHCYYWRSEIVGLHVISDGLTALAYFLIPFALVHLARKRKDLSFNWIFWLFGAFILACGTTHLMAIWTLWHPVYRLEGLIKAITALASIPTAVMLLRLVPQAVALPSQAQLREANQALELEVTERRAAEESLARLNSDLETRITESKADLERSNQDLQRRTNEVEALLTHAPIGFAFFDRDHRYTRINHVLCEINGLPESAHLGRVMSEVLPVNRSTDPILAEVFQTGRAVEREVAGETPKAPGVKRYWWAGFFPIQERDQPVSGAGVFVLEITDRKRTEHSMALLSAIVSSSEDAILSKDLGGVITSWNRGAESLFGYSAAEAIGRNVTMLIPEERLGEETDFLERLNQGQHVNHFETVRKRKDGTVLHISLTLSPLVDTNGKIMGGSKIARDISNRVKNREALKAVNRDLRIANEDLSQFAFAAAHDLREPLRNVRAYTEFLTELCSEDPDQKIQWAKTVIAEGVQRMDDLLSGLLDYTRLGGSEQEIFVGVDVSLAVQGALRNLEQMIETSSAQIAFEALPVVPGNEHNYVQLFQNLIGNAIKYRGTETPRITICAEAKGRDWLFSVRDNGIGIAQEYHGRIFGVFKRLHGKEIPGTGIGLAICQKIVERYRGRIWVESELGKGAKFLFTIPALASEVADRNERK